MGSLTKTALRKKLLNERITLSSETRAAASRVIHDRLADLDWSGVQTVHYFWAIDHLGEVNLDDFLHTLQKRAGIRLYTSRKDGGRWQTVDPDGRIVPSVPKFDAVIVPMLGFDPRSLHRIGFGGGYYDRFLATQPQARKIGVCFEAGKLASLPIEPHDIPLDIIVTEQKTYEHQKSA